MHIAPVMPLAFAPKPVALRSRDGRAVNALSIDVEEHFQVQAMAGCIARSDWDGKASRVEQSTNRALDLFAAHGAKATCFVLGWIAERHPALVKRIVAEGHELASHGYQHVRVDAQTPTEFRADITRTKAILEDLGGVPVKGYRAATFSIGARNPWAFEVLAEAGYAYSSSVNPIRHDLYGAEGHAPRGPFHPRSARALAEYPITTVRLAGRNWPCGGGGFFRLFPYALSRWAIRRVNAVDRMPAIFYFHPWEIDPDQPRERGLPFKSRFRHYLNLGRMEHRLSALLDDFAWDRIDRVFETMTQQSTAEVSKHGYGIEHERLGAAGSAVDYGPSSGDGRSGDRQETRR